jgi:hypothetical protein
MKFKTIIPCIVMLFIVGCVSPSAQTIPKQGDLNMAKSVETDKETKRTKTDWALIRKVMNETIDACEAMDSLNITMDEKCNPEIRWGDFETGVAVGDFLNRFQAYPEGSQRDIIRLRSKLNIEDQKYYTELARALMNTAAACAEVIGVPKEGLDKEASDFKPHCESAGKSMRSQLEGIPKIQNNWMVHEVTNAIKKHREKNK